MAGNPTYSRRRPGKKSILFLCIATLLVVCYELFLAFGGPVGTGAVQQGTVVHFIDVGQGDCALILSGDDAVLIDAGLTATADQVTEYLCAAGVSHLTAAVATHPHEDHIGGIPYLMQDVKMPIHGTRLTIGLVQRKLDEFDLTGIR